MSRRLLKVSKEGYSTVSLGNLCHCFIIHTLKCFLMFRWILLCFTLCSLPLVVALGTNEKSLAPFNCTLPSSKWWNLPQPSLLQSWTGQTLSTFPQIKCSSALITEWQNHRVSKIGSHCSCHSQEWPWSSAFQYQDLQLSCSSRTLASRVLPAGLYAGWMFKVLTARCLFWGHRVTLQSSWGACPWWQHLGN